MRLLWSMWTPETGSGNITLNLLSTGSFNKKKTKQKKWQCSATDTFFLSSSCIKSWEPSAQIFDLLDRWGCCCHCRWSHPGFCLRCASWSLTVGSRLWGWRYLHPIEQEQTFSFNSTLFSFETFSMLHRGLLACQPEQTQSSLNAIMILPINQDLDL